MSEIAEKARAQRLERLRSMLERRLENPAAALEVLISEIVAGDPQPKLWEALHGAAARDGIEQSLASAYIKIASARRMQQLSPEAQCEVLLHAADFYQGVLGDAATAENFLERIQRIIPGHRESFVRLERRLEALGDAHRLIELYALGALGQPKSANDLASKALNKILRLPASAPLSEDACKQVVAVVPIYPSLLDALEQHCRKTKRVGLACTLIEQALADPTLPKPIIAQQRRRAIELYMGEAREPTRAVPHVEKVLEEDPSDATARAAAEGLLSNREAAPRAAAALQKARRQARPAD